MHSHVESVLTFKYMQLIQMNIKIVSSHISSISLTFQQEQWKTTAYYAELQQHTAPYKSLVCSLFSCKENRRGSELKDKIEMTNTHQVSNSTSIGVAKHKYDNYICITPTSRSTVFLSFKTK